MYFFDDVVTLKVIFIPSQISYHTDEAFIDIIDITLISSYQFDDLPLTGIKVVVVVAKTVVIVTVVKSRGFGYGGSITGSIGESYIGE